MPLALTCTLTIASQRYLPQHSLHLRRVYSPPRHLRHHPLLILVMRDLMAATCASVAFATRLAAAVDGHADVNRRIGVVLVVLLLTRGTPVR